MKDGEIGVIIMCERKMEEKGHADTSIDESQKPEKGIFVCPVCRTLLPEDDLVDVKSVIEDNLYYVGGIRIVNSQIELQCNFQHRYSEEGFTIDEPHNLVAVVTAAFDESGCCILFEIVDIRE